MPRNPRKPKAAAAAASRKPLPPSNSSPSTTSSNTLYFYSASSPHGTLSQFYPCIFTSPATPSTPSYTYHFAEQYMMHRKGLLFAPSSPYTAQILAATNPPEIKRLGRKIPNFVQSVWDVQRERIVEEGNYLKFSQNPELRRGLLETGVRELVEAARSDRVWGVGFNERDAEGRRGEWGLNLLGKCLERVRNRIREEGEVIE